MSSLTDPVFYLILTGFTFLVFLYHFFIEKPKTYFPYMFGIILLFMIGVSMYGQGMTVECGTFQDQLCIDPLPAGPNPSFCNDWQWDYNTTYCTNMPYPLPGDTNPAWNPTTQLWGQLPFNANDAHSRTNDSPSMGVTIASWIMIALALLGMANMLRVFGVAVLSKKPEL